jgi:hypothetical protein
MLKSDSDIFWFLPFHVLNAAWAFHDNVLVARILDNPRAIVSKI